MTNSLWLFSKHRDQKQRSFLIKGRTLLSFILLLGLTSGCSKTESVGVIIAGSTSVQPFAEALSEEFMKLYPDIIIDVQGGGSSAGIKSAQTETADIGMSSRSLKEEESGLWSLEIARDGLVVIVHPSNSIDNLSLQQVRDIYSGVITNWKQLGGIDHEIHVITREEGSGTRSAFEDLVMEDIDINPRSIVQDSNGTVLQLTKDDANAIGYISLGLVNETIKALELDGVKASHENVINGSYNLSRPFLFVSYQEPTGDVLKFIEFVSSDEGKALLDQEGLVTFKNEVKE